MDLAKLIDTTREKMNRKSRREIEVYSLRANYHYTLRKTLFAREMYIGRYEKTTKLGVIIYFCMLSRSNEKIILYKLTIATILILFLNKK